MRWLIVLLLTGITASAQVGWGPELGIGQSSYKFAPSTYPIDYTSASKSSVISGKLGLMVDAPLARHIYFQAAAELAIKGGQKDFSYYQSDSFNESVRQTLNSYYAQVPLSVCYKTGMQGKGRFIAALGAVPSYLLGGQNHLKDASVFNDTASNSNGTYPIKAGRTIHAFDIGVMVSAGYEMPTGLFFRAYYLAGVNDIGIGSELDKNRMWGISVGYLLGKGRNINKEADDLIDHSDGK
jgi:Outer membrane protein beta-barrel domain